MTDRDAATSLAAPVATRDLGRALHTGHDAVRVPLGP